MTGPARPNVATALSRAKVRPADGMVVGLSGGADSVALLHLLLEAGVPPARLVAAHLDHALRSGSPRDASFAGRAARRAGVRFRTERLEVAGLCRKGGPGLEALARAARYRFLERVARDGGIPVVATGHHRDDQAETVLFRLLRGTGPRGLRAIRPGRPIRTGSSVTLVRPLLEVSGADLRAWLAERGIGWIEDPTNADGSNARSRIRTLLLPHLREGLPGVDRRLAALAGLATDLPEPPAEGASGELSVEAPHLRVPSRLRAAVRARLPADGPPLDRRAMDRLIGAIRRGSGDADLGSGWRARVRRGRVRLIGPDDGPAPSFVTRLLPVPGEVSLPGGDRVFARGAGDRKPVGDPDEEIVDPSPAPPPYTVRFAREGDRFRPLGYPAETTVFRFLLGQGVPREERRSVPVVRAGGLTVWVVGHRIDERVRLRAGTRRPIRLARRRGG